MVFFRHDWMVDIFKFIRSEPGGLEMKKSPYMDMMGIEIFLINTLSLGTNAKSPQCRESERRTSIFDFLQERQFKEKMIQSCIKMLNGATL